MANKVLTKEDVANKCGRCAKPFHTGDEFVTERLSITNHRWYHKRCAQKDPTIKVHSSGEYRDL